MKSHLDESQFIGRPGSFRFRDAAWFSAAIDSLTIQYRFGICEVLDPFASW